MARAAAPTVGDLHLLDPDGSFILRLAADRDALEASLAAKNDASVRTIVHGLAGAAGTFGYAAIGDIALALDDLAIRGETVPPDGIAGLLAALASATKSG